MPITDKNLKDVDARRRSATSLMTAGNSPSPLFSLKDKGDVVPIQDLSANEPNSLFTSEETWKQQKVTRRQPLNEPGTRQTALADFYQDWKLDKSPKNMGVLLKALEPAMTAAIRGAGSQPSDKTMTLARSFTAPAILKYDDSQSTSLDTWVSRQLAQLSRVIRQGSNAISMSDSRAQLKFRVDNTRNQLTEDLGREPTTQELAEKLRISPKLVEKYSKVNYERTTDPESFAEDAVEDDAEARLQRVAYDAVCDSASSPEDRLIIEKMYNPDGRNISATQVAKLLKISDAAVSKRNAKISAKWETLLAGLKLRR